MSGDATVLRASPPVAWWRRVAGFVLPVLLAFMVIVAVWLEPVVRWLAYPIAWSRATLPRGRDWSLTGDVSSSNLFSPLHGDGGWSGFLRWFDSTPWPALVVVIIALTRMAAWAAARRVTMQSEEFGGARMVRLRFGGFAESTVLVAWCAAGAVAWRFQWGLAWDFPIAGWFPIDQGVVPIGLLWLGAALGYAWTIAVLDCRMARRNGGRRCVRCGYPLRGLGADQRCPECGHDQNVRTTGAMRRFAALSRRVWPPAAALLLLAAPYLSTLLASLVNVLRNL